MVRWVTLLSLYSRNADYSVLVQKCVFCLTLQKFSETLFLPINI